MYVSCVLYYVYVSMYTSTVPSDTRRVLNPRVTEGCKVLHMDAERELGKSSVCSYLLLSRSPDTIHSFVRSLPPLSLPLSLPPLHFVFVVCVGGERLKQGLMKLTSILLWC